MATHRGSQQRGGVLMVGRICNNGRLKRHMLKRCRSRHCPIGTRQSGLVRQKGGQVRLHGCPKVGAREKRRHQRTVEGKARSLKQLKHTCQRQRRHFSSWLVRKENSRWIMKSFAGLRSKNFLTRLKKMRTCCVARRQVRVSLVHCCWKPKLQAFHFLNCLRRMPNLCPLT